MTTPDAPAAAPDATAAPGPVTNADLLAGLAELDAGEKAPEAPAEEPKEEAAEEEAPAEGEADEGDEETDGEESSEDEAPADPEATKRIAQVQKAEKRSKEQLDRQRVELQREFDEKIAHLDRELTPRLQRVEKLEALLASAKVDPVALAADQGWDAETKLHIAQQLYSEAKAEQGDPKYREHAIRARRDREAAGKTSEIEKQFVAKTTELQQQIAQMKINELARDAEAAVTDKTPILRQWMEKNPKAARERIRSAMAYVREQTGADPDPAHVIETLEEVERQELVARGLELPAAKAAPKKQTQEAGEMKTAKPTNKPAATVKPPPGPSESAVSKSQLVQELDDLERKGKAEARS